MYDVVALTLDVVKNFSILLPPACPTKQTKHASKTRLLYPKMIILNRSDINMLYKTCSFPMHLFHLIGYRHGHIDKVRLLVMTRAARLTRKYSVVATFANSRDYEFCLSLGDFLFEKK